MRLSRHLAALAAMGLAQAGCAQALPRRVNIDLLYVTSTNSTLEQHVREWASALNEKLQTLAYDPSFGLAAANQISVTPSPQPISPTAAVIEHRWEIRNAIQIVSGHGRRSPHVSAFEGIVYLGDLRGRLPVAIPINQDINGGSFERSSNFVFVVALYALSVDAAGRPAISCRLLAQARTLAASLPPALTSVEVLKHGIDEDLGGRCRRRGP